MATASLLNLTVPLASDQSASSQGLLMPKLKYRFRVAFENFGVTSPRTELTKQVVDFTRPNVNFNPVTLDIYNSKMYYAGKPEWQAISATLRDDAQGAVSLLVGEQIQKQFDFAQQASAVSGADYKFNVRFEALDGGNGTATPVVLETWMIYGCFLAEVNYNNFEYSSNDAATISLNIRYDNALQTTGKGGVGNNVGRTYGSTVTI